MRKISLIAILCALCAALYAQSLEGNPASTSRVTVDPVSDVKVLVLAQPSASPGPYTVHVELKYQACDNNSCYPPKKVPVAFTVNVSPAPKTAPRAHGNAQSPHKIGRAHV